MRIVLSTVLLLMLLSIVANFSSDSTSGSKDHTINFYGTLITNQNKKYKVDNISISGLSNNIAVYAKPSNGDINPTIDTTRLNLEDIQAITRSSGEPAPILKFKNREYIEITVRWKDTTKKSDTFIIERNRQVLCNELNATKAKKEIALEAITKLEIDGYTYRSQSTEKCDNSVLENSKQSYKKIADLITNTEKTAQEVTQESVKNTLLKQIQELKNELKVLIS